MNWQVAKLASGERVKAAGTGHTGVYMRSVVGVVANQSVYVRDARWTRYRMTETGRTERTGYGIANT